MNKGRDGCMSGCKPLTCTDNCCKDKEIFYIDEKHATGVHNNKESIPGQDSIQLVGLKKTLYNTMLNDYEVEKLLPQVHKHNMTLVQRKIIDPSITNIKDSKQYTIQTAWLLSGCLQAHGCSFDEGEKPINCKVYPFDLHGGIGSHLDTKRCSQAKEIASDPKTLSKILELRKSLGYSETDNKLYKDLIEFILITSPTKTG